MNEQDVTIRCADDFELAATVVATGGAVNGGVVICAALGVPRRFYLPFARFLAEHGYQVLAFDYRGIGDSRAEGEVLSRITLEDWGRKDIDAALAQAIDYFEAPHLFLVGHSCGGQLFGLAERCTRLTGAVLVAATLANVRLWPMAKKLTVGFLWYVLVPALSIGGGMWPTRRLGLGSLDVPAGVMAQWARWARQREYLFTPELGLDTGRYQQLRMPVLSFEIDDDSYGPGRAVTALLGHLPNTRVERNKVNAAGLGKGKLGHFGFFRNKVRETLWEETVRWLDAAGVQQR